MIAFQLHEALLETKDDEEAVQSALQKYRGGATPYELAKASGVGMKALMRILVTMLRRGKVKRSGASVIAKRPLQGKGVALAAMSYQLA